MKQTFPLLAVCSMIVLSLCGAQFLGNHLLILLCCGAFLLLMIGAACKETVFPLLLFFLPWATLLKLSPDGKSFYSIALLLVCGIYCVSYIVLLVLGKIIRKEDWRD